MRAAQTRADDTQCVVVIEAQREKETRSLSAVDVA